ncbi:MAG: c-type cytochrome [Rhizobiaceae bacterium]|nr:c-type cytochrome [Rhizobiaceae bacterium]
MWALIRNALVGLVISTGAAWAGPVGDAVRKGDVAEIERLIDSGADLNEAGAMASPLHFAAMNGQSDIVTLLAKAGADVDVQSTMLGAPLHIAAQRGNSDVIRALLAAGADPNLLGKDNATPLIVATSFDKPEIVRALIENGADVNAATVSKSQGGRIGIGRLNALHVARILAYSEVTDILISAGATGEEILDSSDLLKQADPSRGREYAYARCASCHIIEPGDTERDYINAGPPLHGIFERPVASYPGYEYKEALIEFGGNWTRNRLFTYSLRPMLTVPGTLMYFDDGYTPNDIADVVAYFEDWAKNN